MSVSRIRVDSIVSTSDQSVTLGYGATVPSGQVLSVLGDLNVVGVITASSYTGSGAGISNLPVIYSSASLARVLVQS
jgi:hypothetical protein